MIFEARGDAFPDMPGASAIPPGFSTGRVRRTRPAGAFDQRTRGRQPVSLHSFAYVSMTGGSQRSRCGSLSDSARKRWPTEGGSLCSSPDFRADLVQFSEIREQRRKLSPLDHGDARHQADQTIRIPVRKSRLNRPDIGSTGFDHLRMPDGQLSFRDEHPEQRLSVTGALDDAVGVPLDLGAQRVVRGGHGNVAAQLRFDEHQKPAALNGNVDFRRTLYGAWTGGPARQAALPDCAMRFRLARPYPRGDGTLRHSSTNGRPSGSGKIPGSDARFIARSRTAGHQSARSRSACTTFHVIQSSLFEELRIRSQAFGLAAFGCARKRSRSRNGNRVRMPGCVH